MALKLVTASQGEPISQADVEGQTRIASLADEAGTIALFIQAVRERAETVTRRALITQVWDLVLDGFPVGHITVPLPPLQSVASITYTDGAGAVQTLDPALYRVDGDSEPARIFPAYGQQWPATLDVPSSVRVRFVCGYGDTPDTVPASIRQWMLINTANLYENRESETVAAGKLTMVDLSTLADSLIESYRVKRF